MFVDLKNTTDEGLVRILELKQRLDAVQIRQQKVAEEDIALASEANDLMREMQDLGVDFPSPSDEAMFETPKTEKRATKPKTPHSVENGSLPKAPKAPATDDGDDSILTPAKQEKVRSLLKKQREPVKLAFLAEETGLSRKRVREALDRLGAAQHGKARGTTWSL